MITAHCTAYTKITLKFPLQQWLYSISKY